MGQCASSSVVDDHEEDVFTKSCEVICNGGDQRCAGSAFSKTGGKGINQDAAILYQGYTREDGVLAAVFDGHGKNGHFVSKVVRNRLPNLLLNQRNALLKTLATDNSHHRIWGDACVSAFKVMDKEIKLRKNIEFYSTSGSTAVVVLKHGDELVIANLGDSRAVLGTLSDDDGRLIATQLTVDLKPSLVGEAERIRSCNGRVLALKSEPHIQRVWLPHKDAPGLAMTRAFGDYLLKNHGVISVPEVSYHRISPKDQFVILATDGVWDVMGNDEVVSAVWSAVEAGQSAAKAVVDTAANSWEKKYPTSKVDDCTVVCLFLQDTIHHHEKNNAPL